MLYFIVIYTHLYLCYSSSFNISIDAQTLIRKGKRSQHYYVVSLPIRHVGGEAINHWLRLCWRRKCVWYVWVFKSKRKWSMGNVWERGREDKEAWGRWRERQRERRRLAIWSLLFSLPLTPPWKRTDICTQSCRLTSVNIPPATHNAPGISNTVWDPASRISASSCLKSGC